MITGTHAIIYAEDSDLARAFLRDVLELPYVDAHDGWLIFQLPPAEVGVHPAGAEGDPGTGSPSGHHELYLMCDDIEATVAALRAKGVEFSGPIENQGFGLLTRFRIPGVGEIGLYQPRHLTAYDLPDLTQIVVYPDWQTAFSHLITDGRSASLTHPSAANETLAFPPPVESD